MLRAPVLMRSIRDWGSPTQQARSGRSRRKSLVDLLKFRKYRQNSKTDGFIRDLPVSISTCGAAFNLKEGFRVKISDVSSGEEECVFYKDDENRFSQRYTLKLQTECKYKISIEIDGRAQLSKLNFGGVLWNQFHIQQSLEEGESKCTYSFLWCTDKIAPTARKYRTNLPFIIQLDTNEEIKFYVLMKFYDEYKEDHVNGVPLSFLSLDSGGKMKFSIKLMNFYKVVFN